MLSLFQVVRWASSARTVLRCVSAGMEAIATTSPDCARAAQVLWAASVNRVSWGFIFGFLALDCLMLLKSLSQSLHRRGFIYLMTELMFVIHIYSLIHKR